MAWNSVASLAGTVIQLARYVILRRLLPVDTFGVYSGANALIGLTVIAAGFGMGGAFLHRAVETNDEEEAAAIHFTLKLLFTLAWALVMTGISLVAFEGDTRTAMLLLIGANSGIQLAQTPNLILKRRIVHRRLALIQLLNAFLTTVVASGLACGGATLWALLGTDVVTMVLSVVALYVWRPVWQPRLAWSPEVVRYFLRFGSRNFAATALLHALDRLDDVWTRFFLGTTLMGYYSTAYRFATYPRHILAGPINAVAGGTYAELKGDRTGLSRAFFRTNAFLVRTGFFFGGLLALTAPELIRLSIGEKWLPMVDPFRLMLLFTLLDPIKITIADLFVAVGHPNKVVRTRLLQLVVMVIGLVAMGPLFGIIGVALAVDLMLLVGIVLLLWQARAHVDFSPRRMFFAPALALALGLGLAQATRTLALVERSVWLTGCVKAVTFAAVYFGLVLLLERDQIRMLLEIARQLLPSQLLPVAKAKGK